MKLVYNEFINEAGETEFVTVEPIEVWTKAGLHYIPSGFRFTFDNMPKMAKKLIHDDEIPKYIYREWLIASNKGGCRGIDSTFRHCMINNKRKRQAPKKRLLWQFIKDRVRKEVLCFLLKLARMYLIKKYLIFF